MNQQAKTVMIITNDFPFCGVCSSACKRIMGHYRYLPRHGWRVIVLSRICSCSIGMEKKYQGVLLQGNTRWAETLKSHIADNAGENGFYVGLREGCTPLAVRQRKILAANDLLPAYCGHTVFWSPFQSGSRQPKKSAFQKYIVKKFNSLLFRLGWEHTDWKKEGLKIALSICGQTRVDMVISSSPFLVNHKIARGIQKRKKLLWLCEFRDSVQRNRIWFEGSSKWFWKWRYKFLSKSIASIHVTKEESLQDAALNLKGGHVIENGFFEEEITDALKRASLSRDVFILRYLGSMYDGRMSLLMFLAGLKKLIKFQSIPPEKISFEYYGNSAPLAQREINRAGLKKYCKVSPMVPTDKALVLCASSHVLVLPSMDDADDAPGGKLYEYLALKRPVLATRRQGGYVDRLLKETGCGVTVSSSEAVYALLSKWVREFQSSGKIELPFNDKRIAHYSRAQTTGRLAAIMNNLYNDSGKE